MLPKMVVSGDEVKLTTVTNPHLARNLNKHVCQLEAIVHRMLHEFSDVEAGKKEYLYHDIQRIVSQATEVLDLRNRLLDLQVWSSTKVER